MTDAIDTSKLDPVTLARHLANPEGAIGRAVTANLNKSNAGPYTAALQKLAVADGHRVIEIGFGNGREIPRILAQAKGVTYFGLDISETMIADASAFNAAAVSEGRVTLAQGSSSAIPSEARRFDKALALNTIYFWPDPLTDLRELRRVLRDGSRLVLGVLAPWSAVGRAHFQHGFRFYEQPALRALLADAGFPRVTIDTITETVVPPSGQPWTRDYFIVGAE